MFFTQLQKSNDKLFFQLERHGLLNWMSDRQYLKIMFQKKLGYRLDLSSPETFNEKLQWLKLNDRKPIYSDMVDKYKAKAYVTKQIGEQYIIPTLGVWDSFEAICFDGLPEQFVLKCTHDSGCIVICRDKRTLDISLAKEKLEKALKTSYYLHGREWPYRNVKPRIIAEAYMEDRQLGELRDYKFFCFNGVPKCYKIDFDRFTEHRANYYDMESHLLELGEVICPPDMNRTIDPPSHLDLMRELAAALAKGIPFLRVDFYEVNGSVYFGELTFFPASGLGKFIYPGNDRLLGSWLSLPV